MPDKAAAVEAGDELLSQTSNLRDELLTTLAKLETYADALKTEVLRLKKIAEERADDD
jgi:hypothetical protein